MADKPILYGPDGQPIRREVLTVEIAGPTITGVRSPITGYPGDGLNPRRLASLLREADEGEPLRYLELAEQIEERDLHYAGVLGTRKRSVAQLDIQVDAASDDPLHVQQADMIRDWLTRDELEDELFNMLDAIGKGWSFTEIVWDTSTGQWWPKRLEWRDPRWFRPARHDGTTPLLRGDMGDTPLSPFKFICAVIRAKSGLPIRSGLARLAAWNWMFKAFTQRDWAIFTQTFGQPVRVGKYPSGATPKDKDTLMRAVANIAGDCAAIIPESMLLEFIESKNVGQGSDLYEKRADWLDRQTSKAVLGQTATTDAVTGGLGSGKEHRQVQEDIERADAKTLSSILNRDLVRSWIDLEHGPQQKYPRLRIGRNEEVDIAKMSDSLAKLVPVGLKVQMSEVRDRLGFSDPDPKAELLLPPSVAPAAPPPAAPALQAERPAVRARDAVDELVDDTEALAAPAAEDMIDTVRDLVERAGSLDEVRAGLLALSPKMPDDRFAEAMRMALVMAELMGRADVAGD